MVDRGSPSLVDWCVHKNQHRHGTCAAYIKCGCRCELCRQATSSRSASTGRRIPHSPNHVQNHPPIKSARPYSQPTSHVTTRKNTENQTHILSYNPKNTENQTHILSYNPQPDRDASRRVRCECVHDCLPYPFCSGSGSHCTDEFGGLIDPGSGRPRCKPGQHMA